MDSSCGSFATGLGASFLGASFLGASTFRTSGLTGAIFSFFAVFPEASLTGSGLVFGITLKTGDGLADSRGVNTGIECVEGNSCTLMGVGVLQSTPEGGLPNVEGNTGDSETP